MRNPAQQFVHSLAVALSLCLVVLSTSPTFAQRPVHYFQDADLPPGAIGRGQLQRGGPLPGYFQPVEVTAPEGALVSIAVDGTFTQPQNNRVTAGMLIGEVYRLRVGSIPEFADQEVYPTLEVVHRLYPPCGQETRFPIPVEIAAEDIAVALSGRFVTRVIYLEDPNRAMALRNDPKRQRYFEVEPGQDPLQVADELGRPMAILRMGSRVPDLNGAMTDLGYNYGQPPVMLYEKPSPNLPRDQGLEEPAGVVVPGEIRQGRNKERGEPRPMAAASQRPLSVSPRYPRVPLPGEMTPNNIPPFISTRPLPQVKR